MFLGQRNGIEAVMGRDFSGFGEYYMKGEREELRFFI